MPIEFRILGPLGGFREGDLASSPLPRCAPAQTPRKPPGGEAGEVLSPTRLSPSPPPTALRRRLSPHQSRDSGYLGCR
jgi:hypothetical protein